MHHGADSSPWPSSRVGRQHCCDRRSQRGPGSRASRCGVCGGGNRRAALHHLAPPHRPLIDRRRLVERIATAYGSLQIGSPTDQATLVGPLIDRRSFDAQQRALAAAVEQGGEVVFGGERVEIDGAPEAYYVRPAVVRMPSQTQIVREETFAPILYVMTYETLEEAIAVHNGVPQGLSSAIFTTDQAEAEVFTSASGSVCGIVNVNLGTSGAEIGGAFGGEKETVGGRESGSDSWKRQVTNTINYSGQLPLAQGVSFV